MRTMRMMRASRAAQLAAGALILALPSSAYALSSSGGRPVTTRSRPFVLHAWPRSQRLVYGTDAVVSGTTTTATGPARVALQYRAAGSRRWQLIGTGRPSAAGRFTLRAPVRQSGLVRVVETAIAADATRRTAAMLAGAGPIAASQPAPVAVGAAFRIADRPLDAVVGRPISVSGSLLPAAGGRVVQLLASSGSGWTTVAQTRTGRGGGFHLRFALAEAADRALRVNFAGDAQNRGAHASAGDAVGFSAGVASWYDDAGSTACGFHATYGIANRTLPCGAKVTLSYGGRTVLATVDDRGPYVYGREYDLDQNTAAALGFYGVATVLASSASV